MKKLYGMMLAGGSLGLLASFVQMIEYTTLLKNPSAALSCNLNSVFSCSSVFNAWQSSFFGFPNALMCIVFFTIMASLGLVGFTGSNLARNLRLTMHGLALFFLGFGLWFLQQSTFVIGALCYLCLVCITGLLMVNGAWLRINAPDLPISASARRRLQKWISKGTDVFFWIVLAIVIGGTMYLHFA